MKSAISILSAAILFACVSANAANVCPADNTAVPVAANPYAKTNRPDKKDRLFTSTAVEKEIARVKGLLTNAKLRWMFENCFPNTLDTTVHFRKDKQDGKNDTFVYTGDIHAMWLRDSGAQVWTFRRQFKGINLDPYANAFIEANELSEWKDDLTTMLPGVHERKYEIDSLCYPIRLAYEYWQVTGDASIFDDLWLKAMENVLTTFRAQQRKNGDYGPYRFQRITEAQLDTMNNGGLGNPVSGCGLIASCFRPSDDATTFLYLVPSNFFAVTSLRKAAEILTKVNNRADLAKECTDLAAEVETALKKHATYNHPKFGTIYAFEVDGFGNHYLMDDANVPSLLAMAYLGDVDINDPIYQNTRRFVWSENNPYFFKGKAGEGIGGPHVGYNMAWPMSIMMKAFTSTDPQEIQNCIKMLLATDDETGFMHESFDVNDPHNFTRKWFAWQNTLFGELIIKIINDGQLELLNSIK